MKNISRQLLIGALALIFLNSACGMLRSTPPTPEATTQLGNHNPQPAATATYSGLSSSAQIPITGENVVSMQCQFCAAGETHAILIFPDHAYFDVSAESAINCMTADVVSGRRIVICRGPQSTSFNLNICSDTSNCLQFPVALQSCDLLQSRPTPFAPVFLTPLPRSSQQNTNPGGPAGTPTQAAKPSAPPATNPPALTQPPEPTKEPKPTNEPKPTDEPKPTNAPKPTKEPKPTNEPKPTKESKPTKMPKPTKNKT